MDYKKANLVLLVIMFGIASMINEISACSCMPSHPQADYCTAEYVIVARILRRSNRKINNQHVYKIDTVKSYKMSEKAKQYLKQGRLTTAPNDALCGYEFKIGQLYAIIGRSPSIGLCDYIKEYSQLTMAEKRGIAGGFKKGCSCEIHPCFNNAGCDTPVGGCDWVPWWSCEATYGVCVPSKNHKMINGKPNKCHWRRTRDYVKCLQNP